MKVTRLIAIYDKEGEKHLDDIVLDNISLDILKKIINAGEHDPHLYMFHPITESQYKKFLELLPSLSNYDVNKVLMFFECFQV